ncbi:MAG: M36 family metallopeptidase [Syntrophales bacterium]
MIKKKKQSLSLIFTLPLLLLSALYFTPAYAGPETLGPSAVNEQQRLGAARPPAQYFGETDGDAEPAVTMDEMAELPAMKGQVSSSEKRAVPFRSASGFDVFNAGHGNQWKANFSEKTGKVKLLYGTLSKAYENGPEGVARGFLGDSHAIFGLKQDLSDLRTLRVDRTPEMDHVRFQQTYDGVPIVGVFVLVHSNMQGQVTMVQNSYIQGFQVANAQVVAEEAAKNIARSDLQASLKGATLSDGKIEELIAPYKGGYYYVWKIAIPTRNPFGYWVYHVDAGTGKILYKGNEILSLKTGQGRAFKSNADWLLGKISNVPLKYMFSSSETPSWGYLWGLHADIYDNNGDDPYAPDYKFLYDYLTQADWFDATDAYYQMTTTWDWWNNNVIKKYGPGSIAYFYNIPPAPTFVNVLNLCNAFYSPDITGGGFPGFAFGDENSCAAGSEDLVIDYDVVHHEHAHAIMDWAGFSDSGTTQFGGPMDYYGRAMGEGNADWFAYLWHPKDPFMAEVAWYWSAAGYLRDLDNIQMYPYSVNLTDYPNPGQNMPEEHYTGEIWSGYLYDLYRVLGKNALKYIYQSFFYFDPSGGWMDTSNPYVGAQPDFFDAIVAKMTAEYGLTGKYTSSLKAWGSMASRGINGLLRSPYCNSNNYFYTGSPGCDDGWFWYWNIPHFKTISTKGNLLLSGDSHEYVVNVTASGWDLTAMVTSSTNGIINPYIYLYDGGGNLLTSVGPSAGNKATLKYYNLPLGYIDVVVTGTATAPARGYYTFQVKVN